MFKPCIKSINKFFFIDTFLSPATPLSYPMCHKCRSIYITERLRIDLTINIVLLDKLRSRIKDAINN